ncbi:alpha/beta fold hydrolase [Paraburkholderia fungorum]|uniref:alpha/beta fold hydrolase n=1 Tax=Paraburkholderia fungorum TaxID=134537 RepID=UPI0038B6D4E0
MIHANDVDLFYEEFGNECDPAVLLVMGNSAPGLVWPDAFCELIASSGFRVVRFDQRDTGLSTYVDFSRAPYTLDDLVCDAFEVLNELGVKRAHIVGLSQGGVLAYRMSLKMPQRLASLVILMSSADLRPKNDAFSGAPVRAGELPRPSAEYVAQVIALNANAPRDASEVANRFVENFRLAKGPRSPFVEDAWQALGRAFAERPLLRQDGLTPAMANNSNHALAQKATPELSAAQLASIATPTLIVHGSDDPIFPVDHAHWAAATIPGSTLRVIDGMGHALDPSFFRAVVATLTEFYKGSALAPRRSTDASGF